MTQTGSGRPPNIVERARAKAGLRLQLRRYSGRFTWPSFWSWRLVDADDNVVEHAPIDATYSRAEAVRAGLDALLEAADIQISGLDCFDWHDVDEATP